MIKEDKVSAITKELMEILSVEEEALVPPVDSIKTPRKISGLGRYGGYLKITALLLSFTSVVAIAGAKLKPMEAGSFSTGQALYDASQDIKGALDQLKNEDQEARIATDVDTMDMKAAVENSGKNGKMDSYLTFVNDLLKKEGGSSLKDRDLLYYLLSSKESREEHMRDILEMTEQGGFDGVEIDYEAMKKDMELWRLFTSFVNELYGKTSEKKLKLRVILEPGAPVEELGFVKGPEYVFMCYNLYGYGTEPGPKADESFLISMAAKGITYGRRILIMATAESTVEPTREKLKKEAAAAGVEIDLDQIVCKEAFRAMKELEMNVHDSILREEAGKIQNYDCVILAQASMAHLQKDIEDICKIVTLSSPALCIRQVNEYLKAKGV